MKKLPEIGLYVSKDKNTSMRIYVEGVYGDDPEEFYLVETSDEEGIDDQSAMGNELDNEQWEALVKKYNLEYQG